MNLYYENGLNYLNNQNYNCNKYRARNEFINCVKLSQKFIEERKLTLIDLKIKENHDKIISNAKINIDKIDSSFKININLNDNLHLFNNDNYLDKDNMLILLGKYREYLENILNEKDKIEIEAFLLANIVKIQYTFLQKDNYNNMKMLAEQSVNLAMSINKNWDTIPWFKEIKSILDELRKRFENYEVFDEEEFEDHILEEKKDIFDEIEDYTKKDNFTFIKFIIEKYPPKKLINLEKSIEKEWKENQINIVNVLCAKYNQTNYSRNTYEEKVKYVIVGKIQEHLNQIYHSINPNQHVCDDD
jgi:HEPN domain-containing protein